MSTLQIFDYKPVFILGAGASKVIGGPLLKDFMLTARKLRYSQSITNDKIKEAFDKVFSYQERLRESKAYIGSDIDNLENLFSMMDMDWQTEGANLINNRHQELTQIRESFFTLVIETLKNSINVETSNYIRNIHILAEPNHSSFITFNYDLAIEQALEKTIPGNYSSYQYDYGFSNLANLEAIQRYVLKLHGSANWIYCEKCSALSNQKGYPSPIDVNINKISFKHKIPNCDGRLLFGIIPPTWNKTNFVSELTKVWFKAIEQISLATHLFIIGYSFPRTDAFFDHLIGLALQKSKNLQKVIIINPSFKIKEIINSFFESHFLENRVIISQIRFDQISSLIGHDFNISNSSNMKTFLYRLQNINNS